MNKIDCLFERFSHVGVGVALLCIALALTLIGISVLPVIGLIAAVPFYFLAVYFFVARKSRECGLP